MQLSDIHNLYEYNYWANHRLLDIVEALTPDQFTKELGSSHGGVQGTLVHAMGAEEIWLRRWKGESPSTFYSTEDFPTQESLINNWEKVEMEMMGFCHMLKEDKDLERVVAYKNLKGDQFSQPLWQLMQHLVNHSSYHRGQLVTMLRQLGVQPVSTDMVAFFRERTAG
ncbi:MAG TPA: DinB family protein [Bacteroidota bacterium]|jgi:uncharacterized damage-inducible protein DinB|nr:DinB family protein [Bacteroidota bacterium]